jgi:uncharacterized protein (DUF3084 family)
MNSPPDERVVREALEDYHDGDALAAFDSIEAKLAQAREEAKFRDEQSKDRYRDRNKARNEANRLADENQRLTARIAELEAHEKDNLAALLAGTRAYNEALDRITELETWDIKNANRVIEQKNSRIAELEATQGGMEFTARLSQVEAENQRLREALEDLLADPDSTIARGKARAALKGNDDA